MSSLQFHHASGERDGKILTNDLEKAYEKIFWRVNLFMLPTGGGRKKYIKEVTRPFLNLWTQDTPLRSISLKAIHKMPALLWQKPIKTSVQNHLKTLERTSQLSYRKRGEINFLLL